MSGHLPRLYRRALQTARALVMSGWPQQNQLIHGVCTEIRVNSVFFSTTSTFSAVGSLVLIFPFQFSKWLGVTQWLCLGGGFWSFPALQIRVHSRSFAFIR